jgi:hypothetical protein
MDYWQKLHKLNIPSNEGLGAVLYQKQGDIDRVIAYASRSLRGAERLYPAHKREFLALKWAVTDKFHDYLYGSKFEVKTVKVNLSQSRKYLRTPSDSKDVFLFVGLCPI